MDPRSGWPVSTWQSVSVVAPLAIAAGACATIAMLQQVQPALAFLQSQGVRYLAIDSDGKRYAA
jgi:thiamine biosynthesis lipoprotein